MGQFEEANRWRSVMAEGDQIEQQNQDRSDDGEQGLLMDQFRICVESANAVSDLRARANTYFVTICAGLVAFIGSALGKHPWYTVSLLCIGGVIVAYTWIGLLNSYRSLNSAKFKVICDIEKNFAVQPFAQEWEYLHPNDTKKAHTPLTQREKNVPFAFIALFLIMGVIAMGLGDSSGSTDDQSDASQTPISMPVDTVSETPAGCPDGAFLGSFGI